MATEAATRVASETMRERFYRVTSELLDADERVAVVLADIGVSQLRELGVFERHPDRAINVGIREQLMVSTGAGMALEGMRPIMHSYAPFLVERPFEQVKLDFAHQEVSGVLVSVGASYDWASGGRTHQSPADVAAVSTMPGWTIYVPGHADEAAAALRGAIERGERAYIRLAEQQNETPRLEGNAGIVRVRDGVSGGPTVLAVGPMLDRVLEATEGTEATVLYTARPRPFDGDALRAHLEGSDIALVEPYLEGTSVAALAAALSDRPTRIAAIGVPPEEHRHYGTYEDHDRAFGLDARGLRERLGAFFAGVPTPD
jgi:transketolase